MLKKLLHFILSYTVLFSSNFIYAKDKKKKSEPMDLRKLALPSEVKKLSKKSGAIFYNPSIKDKVLVPVHFWGQVNNSGLHFVPIDTNLVDGISLAGGPKEPAELDNVRLTRRENGELKSYYYDLEDGGDDKAFLQKLRPDDSIFIERDYYQQDRLFYTSLFGVIATVLSSILLYREVKK